MRLRIAFFVPLATCYSGLSPQSTIRGGGGGAEMMAVSAEEPAQDLGRAPAHELHTS